MGFLNCEEDPWDLLPDLSDYLIARARLDAELETRVYSTAEDELSDILYSDMEALNSKERASISK